MHRFDPVMITLRVQLLSIINIAGTIVRITSRYSMATFSPRLSPLFDNALRAARVGCILLLGSSLLASGCTSLTTGVATEPKTLGNGAVEIQGPEYQRKINTTGWLTMAGATIGGGIAGYQLNFLEVNGANGTPKKLPAVSAAITGLSAGLITYLLIGSSKSYAVPDESATEWLKNYNDRLVYVSHVSSSVGVQRITAIPLAAEPTFTPKSATDAEIFAHAFPGSSYTDDLIRRSIPKLNWTELPSLVTIFPNSPAIADVKQEYVARALTVAEAAEAADRYPELKDRAEAKAATFVKSVPDIKRFAESFPESTRLDSLVRAGIPRMSRGDIRDLITLFPRVASLPEIRRAYLDKSNSTEEIVEAARRFPELESAAEPRAAALARNARAYRTYLNTFPLGASAAAIREQLTKDLQKPENLGRNVNSELSDLAPIISPDGKTLYITRDHGQDVFGNSYQDVWFSTIDSLGEWYPVRKLPEPLNNSYSSFICSALPDGNTLLLGGAFFTNGAMQGGVFLTHRTENGWSNPEKLVIKDFYTKGRYLNYFLANDGKTLLMSLERNEGVGGNDLYVSFLQDDGVWSTPMNLGPTVNTSAMDASPFIAADGVTLYFSSGGHGGYGNNDIFVTRRLDNSWKKWSKPVNLGATINTSEWDAYYTIPASGDYAYFVSHKNSLGMGDIMRIGLPEAARPKPVILVAGRVLDAKTGKPVVAQIHYELLPQGKDIGVARSGPTTGEYKITLPSGGRYAFRAEAPGYIAVNDNLDVTTLKEYRELTRDLYLVPIEVGQTVRLNNIFFDFAKIVLRDESFPELNRMVEVLNANPTMEIEIAGHTDNVGTDESNLALSRNRANSVADYLASKGVTRARMKVQGYGMTKPLASNDTEEGRQQNRRVEIKILKR